jgi:hypothetical protein
MTTASGQPAPADSGAVDIFLSYAREDRPCAERLAAALKECGWNVWWDREIIVGADFGAIIEAQLAGARAVIVLWSEHSTQSGFVKDEAARARDTSKLHPVRIADVALPIGFGQIQTIDLFDCATDGPEFAAFVDQLGRAIAHRPGAPVTPGTGRRLPSILKRRTPRLVAAGLLAAGVVGFIARGWWVEKRCNEAFGRTDAGVQRLLEGSTEQAIDFFTEAIRLCNSRALPYRYRGEAYARLNDYELAAADINRALALGLEDHAKRRATELLAKIAAATSSGAIPVSASGAAPVDAGETHGSSDLPSTGEPPAPMAAPPTTGAPPSPTPSSTAAPPATVATPTPVAPSNQPGGAA